MAHRARQGDRCEGKKEAGRGAPPPSHLIPPLWPWFRTKGGGGGGTGAKLEGREGEGRECRLDPATRGGRRVPSRVRVVRPAFSMQAPPSAPPALPQRRAQPRPTPSWHPPTFSHYNSLHPPLSPAHTCTRSAGRRRADDWRWRGTASHAASWPFQVTRERKPTFYPWEAWWWRLARAKKGR